MATTLESLSDPQVHVTDQQNK